MLILATSVWLPLRDKIQVFEPLAKAYSTFGIYLTRFTVQKILGAPIKRLSDAKNSDLRAAFPLPLNTSFYSKNGPFKAQNSASTQWFSIYIQ
jgi:hypothetical protein